MGGLIGSNQHSKRLSAVVLEGHFGGQFQKRRRTAALQGVVAVGAVIGEPVSAGVNSLLRGKVQGISADLAEETESGSASVS
jgi:hypothetical protein